MTRVTHRTVTSRAGKTYSYPILSQPTRLYDMVVTLRKYGVKIHRAPGGLHRCGKKTLTTPELRVFVKSLVKRYGPEK
jgi:hypothetical protein